MMPRIHRSTVVLAVLCVVGFAHAVRPSFALCCSIPEPPLLTHCPACFRCCVYRPPCHTYANEFRIDFSEANFFEVIASRSSSRVAECFQGEAGLFELFDGLYEPRNR